MRIKNKALKLFIFSSHLTFSPFEECFYVCLQIIHVSNVSEKASHMLPPDATERRCCFVSREIFFCRRNSWFDISLRVLRLIRYHFQNKPSQALPLSTELIRRVSNLASRRPNVVENIEIQLLFRADQVDSYYAVTANAIESHSVHNCCSGCYPSYFLFLLGGTEKKPQTCAQLDVSAKSTTNIKLSNFLFLLVYGLSAAHEASDSVISFLHTTACRGKKRNRRV